MLCSSQDEKLYSDDAGSAREEAEFEKAIIVETRQTVRGL